MAEAQLELLGLGLIDEFSAGGYSQFRVIPSIDPVKRTIAVNASVETESQVLPYEILEDHIARVEPQVFAMIPCPVSFQDIRKRKRCSCGGRSAGWAGKRQPE